MTVAGLIFSNIHDSSVPALTRVRTIGSVPFGCRYRLIDFTLSNMVNSNINNVYIIANYNYQSLMNHIGSGKDWDLARHSGGIKILPPYITAFDANRSVPYSTRLEALKGISHVIARMKDEYVVMSDSDLICNMDFSDIVRAHIKSRADITVAVKRMHLTQERAGISVIIRSDESGRIEDVLRYPANFHGEVDVSMNIAVMKREYLWEIVRDSTAHNYTSLTADVLYRNRKRMNYRVYRYDGYFAAISSMEDYFRCNMELLHNDYVHKSLFGVKDRPVYTKVRNSVPSYYSSASSVRNSLIADGCVIEGTVENSILFRGVKIGKNTTVSNSILMQDSFLGEGVTLKYVISDKNTVVRDGLLLAGCERQPYYIDKGKWI